MCGPNLGNIDIGSIVDERRPEEDVKEEHSGGRVEAWGVSGAEIFLLEESLDNQDG